MGAFYSVQTPTWCVVLPSECSQSRPKCIQPRPAGHGARKQRNHAKLLHMQQSLMVNSFLVFVAFIFTPEKRLDFFDSKHAFMVVNVL